MDTVIKSIQQQDLSGSELELLLRGVASLKLYRSLKDATVRDFFQTPAVCLLYPVESEQRGHWIGIWLDVSLGVIHHFDPYGFGPSMEARFSTNPLVQEQLLQTFYAKAEQEGFTVEYNNYKFQQLSESMNTCGRHVIVRLRMRYLSHAEYVALMSEQKNTPDEMVTMLTFLALDEDESAHSLVSSVTQQIARPAGTGSTIRPRASASAEIRQRRMSTAQQRQFLPAEVSLLQSALPEAPMETHRSVEDDWVGAL